MSVADLSAARWEKAKKASDLPPIAALEAARRDIDDNEAKACHVIVCIAYEHDDGTFESSWCQAGSYKLYAQIGLLEKIKHQFLNCK